MTISELLAEVDEIKPNTREENIKIRWLSELEGKIFNTIYLKHVHDLVEDDDGNEVEPTFEGYTIDDEAVELKLPDIYCDVYKNYLFAMIDYSNGETDRYTNSMIMFNTSYQEYANWYNSTHLPIQKPLKVF